MSSFTRVASLALVVCGIAAVPAILFAQDSGGYSRTSRQAPGYQGGSITIDYEGFTIPKFDILVAATEIGRLDAVNVEVGDRVSKGDVVAKLEDGLQAEAVATARWRAQMHGETDAAKAETTLMKLRLEQLQSLADQDVARPDELKRAFADWEIAKSRELGAMEQDQLRKLELSRYELQLRRRKVLAPMDGVVAELFHAPGEYITPADPAVIRLVVLDELYGVFNVPVEEIGMVHLGDKVQVFMTGAGKRVRGEVASIAPDIDGESGTIKVKVLLDNKAGDLRSGDRCRMKPARPRTAQQSPTSSPLVRRIGPGAMANQRGVSGIR
ncbi:efflux RND transporter periplasmic adaptor subunit [Stieleria mannarensis]|uniref:efflux RND transporter periplasmic adaptor subunit n=1 Tax=Stieleria mannarensis TaxID=2755585 RepID=UPI001600D992|nr:efflux RND transporter periplasmic adaptor subunit [Rhodopirellula sp. JC639]